MTEGYSLQNTPRTYEQKYEGNIEQETLLWNRLNDLKKEINTQLPCEVVGVDHNNNQVSVKILDYDSDDAGNIHEYSIISNVPIRQPMDSGSAYIRLPVQIGDMGTIEFFDSPVDDILTQDTYSYNIEEEWHQLSDGLFTNGFLSKGKLFEFDDNSKIEIGTKSGKFIFKVNSDDELEVISEKMTFTATESLNITSPIVNITGITNITGATNITGIATATVDVVGGGKSLLSHTHPYTDDGTPKNTGAPN